MEHREKDWELAGNNEKGWGGGGVLKWRVEECGPIGEGHV